MCGLVGIYGKNGSFPSDEPASAVADMAGSVVHRGPDDSGFWTDPFGGLVLGHRRLAVLDLSETGHQPMVSSDGRWVIAYNGEMYNSSALLSKLSGTGRRLRGHSDTEVLVEAIANLGVERTLETAVGMFAFAAWDSQKRELWLARDRFGEKPLYYGRHNGAFVFASELKAIRALPGPAPEVDRTALSEYFRWTYVPAPRTIYQNIFKLEPGHYLKVTDPSVVPAQQRYWSPVDTASRTSDQPAGTAAVDRLSALLDQCVDARMVSDVPLGAFLSGGVDSSAVVASMRRVSSAPVRTFTIGFTDRTFDESGYAAEVAGILGTEHTDLMLTPEQAMNVIPQLATIYDEPFADSSQIPTFLVSQMARENVTVALSGDGGDELFGGYERYRLAAILGRAQSRVPSLLRSVAGSLTTGVSVDNWNRLANFVPDALLPAGLRHRTGQRLHKAAAALCAGSFPDAYGALIGVDHDGNGLVIGGEQSLCAFSGADRDTLRGFPPFEQAMLVDTLTYLPGDLMTKVDRASMAVSLEVRAPFLDPALFEFAWGLSADDRVRDGQGKWVLRELLRRSLPDHLVDRPKMGFGVPIGDWIRGPMRPWAEDLLDPKLVSSQGYLDPEVVTGEWHAHRDCKADLTPQVWSLLMFQSWLAEADL